MGDKKEAFKLKILFCVITTNKRDFSVGSESLMFYIYPTGKDQGNPASRGGRGLGLKASDEAGHRLGALPSELLATSPIPEFSYYNKKSYTC